MTTHPGLRAAVCVGAVALVSAMYGIFNQVEI